MSMALSDKKKTCGRRNTLERQIKHNPQAQNLIDQCAKRERDPPLSLVAHMVKNGLKPFNDRSESRSLGRFI